jgi:probable rRNA maturation factor
MTLLRWPKVACGAFDSGEPKGATFVPLTVEVQRRVRTWAPPRADIAAWASTALGRKASGRELGVRVVGPTESRRLNARYRGRDKPTNVLSFPAAELPAGPKRTKVAPFVSGSKAPKATFDSWTIRPLGDLVICPDVLRAEAREQHKSLREHWAHLVVHGALHLIGYDHMYPADADRMERREISVLRRLGFPNPYRSS